MRTSGMLDGSDEPAHDGPFTVPELAARLREDQVVVQQMLGNGQTTKVNAALTDLAASVDYPVYVALVDRPAGLRQDDPTGELVSLLHAEIGTDGLYIASADPVVGHLSWQVYGAGLPDVYDFSVNPRPPYDSAERHQAVAGEVAELVATAANDLEPLPRAELEDYRTGDLWVRAASGSATYDDPPTPFTYAMVSSSIALVMTFAAFVALRAIAARRERPRTSGPDQQAAIPVRKPRPAPQRAPRFNGGALPSRGPEVRAAAERELDDLAAAIRRASRGDRSLSTEAMQIVDGSRSTAEALLADLPDVIDPHSPDLLDAVGALVLVRIARRAVDDPAPYRPCFFDPCHGEGDHQLTTTAGDGEVRVPVCRLCLRDRDDPERFRPLRVRRLWGRPWPYYEGDSVWAKTGFGSLSDDLWRDVDDSRRQP